MGSGDGSCLLADMKLTEILNPQAEEFSLDTHTRSPGLHLSDILESMELDLGVKRGGKWDKNSLFTLGFLWERVLKYVLQKARYEAEDLIPVGEMECDGIYLTPDAMDVAKWEHHENKCTFKSMRNDPAEYYRYWWQVKAGCYVLETNVAVLNVLFIMGDYKGSGPRWKSWRAEFTDRELKENWQAILSQARKKGML
jgi:hypothetical protein